MLGKKCAWVLGLSLLFSLSPIFAADVASTTEDTAKKIVREKVETSLGMGWFRKNGYVDFVEPRVSFVKRKKDFSEVIEYDWRPMQIFNMPHKERIDVIRCSFNRYYYSGQEKKIFYGFGLGGNILLFNSNLKDWGAERGLSLKDGVNGLGRLFGGYKVAEVQVPFLKTKYPVVVRFDAIFSPTYKFGGYLGAAGDRLKLTEFSVGLGFSIE